ncbi:MAG TPA: DUF2848 domain-containing protein [Burkholderiaceae bacterium]|nr:DUF2848 domain-containing protein [Burkholderiaceae bacterium]
MKLSFELSSATRPETVEVDFQQCIVAGWAGRDLAATEHHIEELALLGVTRPSSVPLFYRIASNQLVQDPIIDVVGEETSGEAEVFLFSHQGETLVSLSSDHTDRKLEAHSVALSKQICAKPLARHAWRHAEVADHWDDLILRSWIKEDGNPVLYQEGNLGTLLPPLELAQRFFGSIRVPEGSGMTCGTVSTIGAIRPASGLKMELFDPKLGRSITHAYTLCVLPEIA